VPHDRAGRLCPLPVGAADERLVRVLDPPTAELDNTGVDLVLDERANGRVHPAAAPRRRDTGLVERLHDRRPLVAVEAQREDPPHDRRRLLVGDERLHVQLRVGLDDLVAERAAVTPVAVRDGVGDAAGDGQLGDRVAAGLRGHVARVGHDRH
jgi:hypothetical protein